MRFYWISLLLLVALLLSSCVPPAEATPSSTPPEETPAVVVEAESSEAETEPVTESEQPAGEISQNTAINATCTVETEPELVPPVSEEDWVFGPEDATVTILEYSDFQ